MKKVIASILILATILVLCACGRKPTAAEKAQAEAKAAQEALENAIDRADKAKEQYDEVQDLIDKIRGG